MYLAPKIDISGTQKKPIKGIGKKQQLTNH